MEVAVDRVDPAANLASSDQAGRARWHQQQVAAAGPGFLTLVPQGLWFGWYGVCMHVDNWLRRRSLQRVV
jgi:hypothetical protein